MRLSLATLVTSALVLAAGALGVLGSWAVAAGLIGGVVALAIAATALEGRDLTASSARPVMPADELAVAGLLPSEEREELVEEIEEHEHAEQLAA